MARATPTTRAMSATAAKSVSGGHHADSTEVFRPFGGGVPAGIVSCWRALSSVALVRLVAASSKPVTGRSVRGVRAAISTHQQSP